MTVLALRALGLGDLLTAVPALRALRRYAGPVTLALPPALGPLARHAGVADDVLPTGPLRPLGCAPPGLAVNLHGRGPQSTRLLLDLGPERLVAFACDQVPGTAGLPAWWPDEHEVVRWCRLLTESGIPADPADLQLAPPPVRPLVRGAVLVHPGGAAPSRRWPAGRWSQVAGALAARQGPVYVTGGPDEVELARTVATGAGLPGDAVLAGRTDLLGLAALVSAARLLVSADTGAAHLATAFGTPSVVLFGPTSPQHWGPPPDRPQHRVLWAGRPSDPQAGEPAPGLLAITPEQVLAEVA